MYHSRQEIYDGLAKSYLSQEQIAKEAYAIWQSEGCPDGEQVDRCGWKIKDWHWKWAQIKLECACDMDADFICAAYRWMEYELKNLCQKSMRKPFEINTFLKDVQQKGKEYFKRDLQDDEIEFCKQEAVLLFTKGLTEYDS